MTTLLAQIQPIPQSTDYIRILPELILSAFGILVMVLDPLMAFGYLQVFCRRIVQFGHARGQFLHFLLHRA